MKTLIYLHGFNSSPASHKAKLTQQYFNQCSSDLNILVPKLAPEPLLAISQTKQLIENLGLDNLVGFVGSSLGGYYSLHLLSAYFNVRPSLKAVLINPAVKPYELLTDYVGENTNYYTGETYTVLPEHMTHLKSLALTPEQRTDCVRPDSVFILTQTKDEVLPYQQALDYMPEAKAWIQSGGDHSFCDYEKVLPAIKSFFSSETIK